MSNKKNWEEMKIERTGEINKNKYGSIMKIIKYNNHNNVIIQFENGFITQTGYILFKKGYVSNPYDKSCYGIGYLGEGVYKTKERNKSTPQYSRWVGMMTRCYNENFHIKQPTYKDCSVCEEWHCFQNFAQWYDENYYEIDDEVMQLDKDILIKGNKIYSPENCVFVPQCINKLFTKTNSKRGDLPIGVSLHKRKLENDNYLAKIDGRNKKSIHIGLYNTPEEAFYLGYKPSKEKLIKQIADKYKEKIPKKLYNAMYRYVVKITD